MKILMVDDFLDCRIVMDTALQALDDGLEVWAAESAQDAFDQLGMNDPATDTSDVDLILMDIDMPEIDGVEACRRIKSVPNLRDIPIIMVTGHDELSYLKEAFTAGAFDYIIKPARPIELGVRVRSALSLKAETDRRKLAYAQLEQVSLAKTQILATVSHELKTPLTSVIGYVNMLLTSQDTIGPLNERQQKYLEYVAEGSTTLQLLIGDLLDLSRIEAGELKLSLTQVEVQTEVEYVVRAVQAQFAKKSIQVDLDLPSRPVLAKADRLRFSQIMTNLVSNAHKYSPAGSTVTITAREIDDLIRVKVCDQGLGISEEDQAQLFTKFFRADNSSTRNESGTGLGLYITRLLVQAQGGRIWCKSLLGNGSVFGFTLPAFSEAKSGEEISSPGSLIWQ